MCEIIVSPISVESFCLDEQDVMVGGPSNAKSPRIEKSVLERMRASLKEEKNFRDKRNTDRVAEGAVENVEA